MPPNQQFLPSKAAIRCLSSPAVGPLLCGAGLPQRLLQGKLGGMPLLGQLHLLSLRAEHLPYVLRCVQRAPCKRAPPGLLLHQLFAD